ncbi:hypothetical protein CC86DRAFT_214557 [Ophiobolus disseminans]|uniref:Uncharacterized protein n=1 Tax=Ophiobolus disseminans TaxID=1469910 RepID=A0A6A7A2V7_9PLEO|nr:hypothetical protein CC86DRAFT_214557 [Ophiobolus disseminans]
MSSGETCGVESLRIPCSLSSRAKVRRRVHARASYLHLLTGHVNLPRTLTRRCMLLSHLHLGHGHGSSLQITFGRPAGPRLWQFRVRLPLKCILLICTPASLASIYDCAAERRSYSQGQVVSRFPSTRSCSIAGEAEPWFTNRLAMQEPLTSEPDIAWEMLGARTQHWVACI